MKNKYISITLIVFIIILLFLLSSFVSDVSRLRRNDLATHSDASLVAGWMTFNYLNKSFHLPPAYLQNDLNISDSAYPNITIYKIAKEQGVFIGSYLDTIKNAINTYLAQNTTPG
jgi:hypothetical protein